MKTLARPSRTRMTPMIHSAQFWLGFNLQRLRRSGELTQERLAKLAKVGVRTLRDIETATPGNNPELDTIAALAGALGVEVAALFQHDAKSEAAAAEFSV
jgi:transcriptional regulator with XRE-family HTH domain